ncbi:MAG: hypothetical protein Q7R41_08255 [Phycisphaerales bacterium]|nr:hypothetical protein [Phycisphaerales bacterium]
MLRKEFCQQDVSMGNEDSYSLVFDTEKAEFFVEHWWSHRESGSQYDFESRTEKLTIAELKVNHRHQFDKLVALLREIGLMAS